MNKYKIYLSVLIAAHFILFYFTGLFRHWGFLTSINDLAHFDQAIWGTIHGNFLLNTDVFNMPTSRLAMHFDPIQLIFVPFYLIYPSVVWLIAGQSLALAITAWPIFLLAKRVLESEFAGLMWAAIYLVNPFVLNAGAWDFHPITIAVPFVALGMLAIEIKNFKLMVFCSLVILMCKEHLGIMIVGFGLLWWLKNKEIKKGLILSGLGLLHFYVVLKVIMPYFSPTGKHLMFSEGLGQISRYSWLGGSIEEIFKKIILNPFEITKTVLFKMGGAKYLVLLLLPFIGFPLFGWYFLLAGIADLASNMLSGNPMPRGIIAYHSVSLIPIFSVAAIYGCKLFKKYTKKISENQIMGAVVLCSCLLGYLFAPLPLPGAMNIWAPTKFFNFPDPRLKEIKLILKDSKKISVQANVGAHFSQRKEIYRFPQKVEEVDAIVLRISNPTKNIISDDERFKEKRQYMIGMYDSHLQMDRDSYFGLVEKLLENNRDYGVVYWDDPWLVIERGCLEQFEVKPIKQKIENLRVKVRSLANTPPLRGRRS